jgi:eukaryotic-like serine/threonine-protein kinase
MSEMLGGRYLIGEVWMLRGALNVYPARDVLLDQPVVILLSEVPDNDTAGVWRSRWQRISQLKGEHVVRLLDVGISDTRASYVVLEFLQGKTLDTLLAREGALPIGQAVDFLLQACDALAEAHSLGILHRDIKPSNLLAVERPDGERSIKVLGWDTSTTLEAVSATSKDAIAGTPLYMSPEAWLGDHLDERTDIWSIGVTLCQLVTGGGPFPRIAFWELPSISRSEAPVLLPDSLSEMPLGLQAIIRKCLEKDRAKRYATVAELAVSLREFGSERSGALVDRICSIPKRMS